MQTSLRRTHLAYLGNGQDYHVQRWLAALVEQGLQVTLLTFTPPSAPESETLAIHPLGRPWRRSLSAPVTYLDFLGPARYLRQALASLCVDVLMASFASTYGFLASRSGFRPLIIQTWSRDVTQVPFRGWKQLYFRPVVSRVLAAADVITTDGPAYAELVRARFPSVASRVVSTLWGIRLSDYDVGAADRMNGRRWLDIPAEAVVCTSGRGVRSWYRPEVTLPALSKALDAEPMLYAVILTLAHERTADVAAQLERLRVHPRVRVFDRFLSTAEMRSVWAASDLIVSIPRFDGVSEGVLEAMLSGAIPILSDIPSNRAVFAEDVQAFYVDGQEEDELADRIVELAGRLSDLRVGMVPSNREWVRMSASVEATARQLSGIVHSLASERRSSSVAAGTSNENPDS